MTLGHLSVEHPLSSVFINSTSYHPDKSTASALGGGTWTSSGVRKGCLGPPCTGLKPFPKSCSLPLSLSPPSNPSVLESPPWCCRIAVTVVFSAVPSCCHQVAVHCCTLCCWDLHYFSREAWEGGLSFRTGLMECFLIYITD